MALAQAGQGIGEVRVHARGWDLRDDHDEGRVVNRLLDGANRLRPVGNVQARGDVHESAGERLDDLRAAHARDARPHLRVESEHVHLVARTVGQSSQEEGGFDGGIQTRGTSERDGVNLLVLGGAQERRGGASAIDDDEDVTVAFGAPLAHHELG